MKRNRLAAPFAALAILLGLAACGPTSSPAHGGSASSVRTSASPSIAPATTDPANPPGNSDGNQPAATTSAPTSAPVSDPSDNPFAGSGFTTSRTLPDAAACNILDPGYMTSLVDGKVTRYLTAPQKPNWSYCGWDNEARVSGKVQTQKLAEITITCGKSAIAAEKTKEGVADWKSTKSKASNARVSNGTRYAGGIVRASMGGGTVQECWVMTGWIDYNTLADPNARGYAVEMLDKVADNIK